MFSRIKITKSAEDFSEKMERLKSEIDCSDAVLIGAGAGLSTSAGFVYTGERFQKYFRDYIDRYGFRDMYSGGFYPFETLEENWAYWSRYIYINRYMAPPKPVYDNLLGLVKNKDYFVLTTNVDHCFQKAGFNKSRLFYTQGDFGLFQCSEPCHDRTYDNEETVKKMVLSQGFQIAESGVLEAPGDSALKMSVPSEMVPFCPVCGKPVSMNLRADDTFVQDDGWYAAGKQYQEFIKKHENDHILYLELGVGMNTPGIIKYPFWQRTASNKNAVYACVNYGEAYCPEEIAGRSICIDDDIAKVLERLKKEDV